MAHPGSSNTNLPHNIMAVKWRLSKNILLQCVEAVRDFRQIKRVRASESVTYMLSNSDRTATKDRGHGVQIGYVLPGSSFPNHDVRAVTNLFYSKAIQSGGRVPALVYDGQFHKLLSTSNTGEPLTIFQLQKQCWEAVKGRSKEDLVHQIQDVIQSLVKPLADCIQYVGPNISVSFSFPTSLQLTKSIFNTSKEVDEQTCKADNTVLDGECSFVDEVIALSDPNNKSNVQNRRQDLNDVDSDDDNENEVTTENTEISPKVLLTVELISGLSVFLHQSSKLHSLSDMDLFVLLHDIDKLYNTTTVSDIKSIIKWLKAIFPGNEHVGKLKLTGKKYDLVYRVSQCLYVSPLTLCAKTSGESEISCPQKNENIQKAYSEHHCCTS